MRLNHFCRSPAESMKLTRRKEKYRRCAICAFGCDREVGGGGAGTERRGEGGRGKLRRKEGGRIKENWGVRE